MNSTPRVVRIDGSHLSDWESFHTAFANACAFPDYYGRNLDAWIDCMSDLVDPTTLVIENVNLVPSEIYDAIVECSAFVNWRAPDSASLMLAFCRTKG